MNTERKHAHGAAPSSDYKNAFLSFVAAGEMCVSCAFPCTSVEQ